MRADSYPPQRPGVTFHVSLVDGSGAASTIHIGEYNAGASKPYQRTGLGTGPDTGTGWQNEYGTIRVRLTDFLAQNTGLDLADIAAIRFESTVDP